MNTLQYIFRIIKRFGLFGTVDTVGLVEEIQNYQIELIKNSGVRERNIELLDRINQVIEIRRKMNSTLDNWVSEIRANPDYTEVEMPKYQYGNQGDRIRARLSVPDLPFPEEAAGSLDITPPKTSTVSSVEVIPSMDVIVPKKKKSNKPRKPKLKIK